MLMLLSLELRTGMVSTLSTLVNIIMFIIMSKLYILFKKKKKILMFIQLLIDLQQCIMNCSKLSLVLTTDLML